MRSTLAKLRARMTYANVISTIALFLALGTGTAFAVAAANSVVSSSIKDGEVKNADIGGNQVTGNKVNESTLGKVPVAGRLSGGGPVASPVTPVPAGKAKVVKAKCPTGLRAVAGGYNVWVVGPNNTRVIDPNLVVTTSSTTGPSWQVQVGNYSSRPGRVQVQASCLPVGPAAKAASSLGTSGAPRSVMAP
jgi:hypothetical protein